MHVYNSYSIIVTFEGKKKNYADFVCDALFYSDELSNKSKIYIIQYRVDRVFVTSIRLHKKI